MVRRRPLRPDEFAALCGARVVRVADLVGLGVARSTIAERCRRGGPWRRLLPGVVKLDNGPVTRDDRRRAGLLYAGGRALITGADALELHGMERMPRPSGPVHLLVPEDCRRAGGGRVLAERTARMPEPEPGRWPITPVGRAALDHVRRLDDRDLVRAVLAEVVQRGRCTPAALAAELAAGCSRGSAVPRLVLQEVSAGVRSVAEADARLALRGCGLPEPRWNAAVFAADGTFLGVPDAWFDEVAMAWEIDSVEWHLRPADYERTVVRRSLMTSAGIIVMQTLPSGLADRAAVRRDLRGHHALAASRPRPDVVAAPRADERHVRTAGPYERAVRRAG
jgi:hypothetical protein